jgi:hypothetical protein
MRTLPSAKHEGSSTSRFAEAKQYNTEARMADLILELLFAGLRKVNLSEDPR